MIVEFRDVLHAFLFSHGLSERTAMFQRIKRSVSRWLKFSPSSRRRSGRRGPGVEPLETRVLLAMRVWDGGATLNDRWTDPTNWKDNIAPVAGDDLVFPAGVNNLDLGTRNDFPINTVFGNITFTGSGYRLTGNRIQLSGDVFVEGLAGGASEIRLDVRFTGGDHVVEFVDSPRDHTLTFNGILSNTGSGSLRILAVKGDENSGMPHNVVFAGSAANTYANPLMVEDGVLILDKSDNVAAIAGPMFVNTGGFVLVGDRDVAGGERNRIGQFKSGVPVTLSDPFPSGDPAPRLQIARETLGSLSLDDVRLLIRDVEPDVGGVLTLTGNVTSRGRSSISPEEFGKTEPLSEVGFSSSTGSRVIDVVSGSMGFFTSLTGGNLIKVGAGQLNIDPQRGANAFSGLTIRQGGVAAFQRFPNQRVLPASITIGGFNGGPTSLFLPDTIRALPSNATINVRAGGSISMRRGDEVIRQLSIVDGDTGSDLNDMLLTITDDLVISRTQAFLVRNGSQLNVADDLFLSSSQLSVFESSQMTLGDAMSLRNGDVFIAPGSSLLLGGNVTVNADGTFGRASQFIGGGTLFLKFGSHTFAVADVANGDDLLLDTRVRTEAVKGTTGTASIVKQGPGRISLDSTDQHNGPTLISAGEYRLDGFLQNSLLSIANGALLSGIGQARNVVVATGGRFQAGGVGTGQFRATDFTLLFGSTFTTELVSATAFDQLQTQVLRLDQFLVDDDVRFPILDVQTTATFPLGTAFQIIDVTGTGVPDPNKVFETPDGTPLPDGANFLVNGQNFTIDYNGGDGNDVVITRNNAPAFQNRRLTPVIFEGGIATLSGRITEPNAGDTFFLDVDWGDGKQETFTFGPDTPRQVRVRHRYLKDSDGLVNKRYTVNVEWRDQYGGGNKAQMSIRVLNTRPNFTHLQAIRVSPRNVQLTGILQDLGQHDAHRVLVQWNPGGRYESVTLTAGTTNFELQHRYAASGLKQIKVLVFDDSPGFTLRQLTIRV